MEIRSARRGEGASIAKVHVASWQTTYKDIIKQEVLDSLAIEPRATHWENVIQNIIDPAHETQEYLFVAQHEEHGIVGFASGGVNRSKEHQADGELYAIYLLEQFQQQGIGRMLIAQLACVLKAKGMQSMLVWVLADNPAKKAYEKLGASLIDSTEIEIAGDKYLEYALKWKDIDVLIQ